MRIHEGLGKGVIDAQLEKGGDRGSFGFLCKMNSVRAGEVDSVTVLKVHRQQFGVWVASMNGITEESPEGFTGDELQCDLESSDFISTGIHFEAERCSIGTLSDVLAVVTLTELQYSVPMWTLNFLRTKRLQGTIYRLSTWYFPILP